MSQTLRHVRDGFRQVPSIMVVHVPYRLGYIRTWYMSQTFEHIPNVLRQVPKKRLVICSKPFMIGPILTMICLKGGDLEHVIMISTMYQVY